MSPDDPRHGSPAGYDAHRRAGDTPCTPCRDAAAHYEYRRRIDSILGRRYTMPGLGTARRIQALVALGWTFRQIGDAIGCSHDVARKIALQVDATIRTSTARRVDDAYKAMSMTVPPQTTGRERWRVGYAKTTATRNGWAPPLAWDDIDDPDEEPLGVDGGGQDDSDDDMVVERILAGDWRLKATPTQRLEVINRWLDEGRSQNALERLTGWNVNRDLRNARKDAAA